MEENDGRFGWRGFESPNIFFDSYKIILKTRSIHKSVLKYEMYIYSALPVCASWYLSMGFKFLLLNLKQKSYMNE